MNYAVIDIGSNTVKCEVFSYTDNKLEAIDFITNQLGIVARIKNSLLLSQDIELLCDTISSYKEAVKKYDARIYCFATESLRRIENLCDVESAIRTKCAFELEMVSGEQEALYSFIGFKATSPDVECGIMADMGGGSTEILKFDNEKVLNLNSFRFGCLSLRRDHVSGRFPTDDEKKCIQNEVRAKLEGYDWICNTDKLCLIGGTGSAIGKLALKLGYTSVPEFPIEVFMKLFDHLSDPDEECIKLLEKYIPARIETILPGMCAYRTIIERINAKTVYVSKGGIRQGFLLSKLNVN